MGDSIIPPLQDKEEYYAKEKTSLLKLQIRTFHLSLQINIWWNNPDFQNVPVTSAKIQIAQLRQAVMESERCQGEAGLPFLTSTRQRKQICIQSSRNADSRKTLSPELHSTTCNIVHHRQKLNFKPTHNKVTTAAWGCLESQAVVIKYIHTEL